MYEKTSRIIIPTREWLSVGMKIDRYRMKTLLDRAAKANQLDNWNNGDTTEGERLFIPRTHEEKILWDAIRLENRKLFQRSNNGRKHAKETS